MTAGPTGPRRWARDAGMGVRFAVAGGRSDRIRTALTALGVALGVAVLLLAASVPAMVGSRLEHAEARDPGPSLLLEPGPDTVLWAPADTEYRGADIGGRWLQPDAGAATSASPPPGLDAFPGPGEMAVSPALADLLDSPRGALLAERLDLERVAVIGDEGLTGAGELYFYAGTDGLAGPEAPAIGRPALRTDGFGAGASPGDPMPPVLVLLVLVICVVLLMPVAVFVGTAVRFGGDGRDRRLAALRLVGADAASVRRIAAGEALAAAALGVVLGCVLFRAARAWLGGVTLWELSTHPEDISPGAPFAALVVLAVPASAVAVTLVALRGVTIEPLGVVRETVVRPRRLGWRLAPAGAGLALLTPLVLSFEGAGGTILVQAGLGIVLLLFGTTALLPWLVERLVGGLGAGPVSWQLAVRRLQLGAGPAARAVSGIVVAVAGATALSMMFGAVRASDAQPTGQDPARAQLYVSVPGTAGADGRALLDDLAAVPGVTAVTGYTEGHAALDGPAGPDGPATVPVRVGDCAALRELARVGDCADGDAFLVTGGDTGPGDLPAPGDRLALTAGAGRPAPADARRWTVPDGTRTVPTRVSPVGDSLTGVLATPGALDPALPGGATTALLRTGGGADPVDRVRNLAWQAGGGFADVREVTDRRNTRDMVRIQQGLLIGASGVMAVIGAGLLVTTLEQLRERRRLLSVLVAFGVRRSVLGASVLFQTAVPVVLGLALASAIGTGLGVVLMRIVDLPVGDWLAFAPMAGTGAAVLLAVTALSMPPLWRMMRPDGLRTE